jgi:hypothetical protein
MIFKIRQWHILDTVFLYIPLGHAIGRISCLIVGCCWGRKVTVYLLGLPITFQNPTPLWAIGINLCIFYFLKQFHTFIYLNPANTRNYKGAITASYLVLYGVDRFFMEVFRTERIVAQGLTQAQIVMLTFMTIGFCIYGYIKFIRRDMVSSYISTTSSNEKISQPLIVFVIINLFLLSFYYFYQIYALGRMLILQKGKKIPFWEIPITQLSILIVLSIGICIYFYIKKLKNKTFISETVDTIKDRAYGTVKHIKPLILLASFVALTLFLISLFYYLVMQMKILPFPFQKVRDISTAYKLILTYLPFLVLPIISVVWMKRAELPIWEKFTVKGNPKTIVTFTAIGLAASIFYSCDLLIFREPRLRGAAFWPPVLILSVINAFSEEIAYRLTTYSLVLNANFSRVTAIFLQAILYSTVHFFFNPTLGTLSLVYGIIMGILMDRTQSISLCILCHFIIDLGAIGRPILAY